MTRFGRPIVGKIRTRFEMPRATGGCQVSHSAGRQIFNAAYRFYWYIEYFLRPRERGSVSSLRNAIEFSCCRFRDRRALSRCRATVLQTASCISSSRNGRVRCSEHRETESGRFNPPNIRQRTIPRDVKKFWDNCSPVFSGGGGAERGHEGLVKIDVVYVMSKINARPLRPGQQWPIFVVTYPHRLPSFGLSPREAIILNSGPAASHGMSWRPPVPSLFRFCLKGKRDMTRRNDGDGGRNVVQST